MTIKRRLPLTKRYSEQGLNERIEEEAIITQAQEKALLAGELINALPYRLIPYIAPHCGKLKPTFLAKSGRRGHRHSHRCGKGGL